MLKTAGDNQSQVKIAGMQMKEDVKYSALDSYQKQAWKGWNSLKISTFVLSSAVLVFVVSSKSVPWHLQKFWGSNTILWQTRWENLHQMLGGNEVVIFLVGTIVIPAIFYCSFNGIMLVVHVTGKPKIIARYKIQLGKNDPVDKLWSAFWTVAFNGLVVGIPVQLLMLAIMKRRGDPCSLQLPNFHWLPIELVIFGVVEEILFFYSHRLFHHPFLYKHIHKKHHEWTAPIGIISIYCHPVEHVISNVLPVFIGPILMKSHIITISLWVCLAVLATSISHCGYHLPFLPSSEFHDFHHLKFNQCYGVVGIMDRLHGTDKVFRQSKAYERHVFLLGFTPLSESIPDSPHKSD